MKQLVAHIPGQNLTSKTYDQICNLLAGIHGST